MSIIAIHQPQYFPWFGLLHKMITCDRFIILDNVQFNRRSFQNRALYATQSGHKYLTIPVHAPNHQSDALAIRAIEWGEAPQKIRAAHFQTLRHRYGKTPGWREAAPEITALLLDPLEDETPYGLIIASMNLTLKLFGVEKPTCLASSWELSSHKDQLMLDLTRSAGGRHYLSGQGAKIYTRPEIFSAAQIELRYQEFTHPDYPQSHGGPFAPGCMALDLFFEDPDAARRYAQRVSMR